MRDAARTAPAVSPAFVITCAFVRIVPLRETTKPEPWAATPPKYENTVTTPGARRAKTRAAGNADGDAAAGAAARTAAGASWAGTGARTTTVSVVVEPPTRPNARPRPGAAAGPGGAQISARGA